MTGKAENVAAAADAGGKEPNGLGIVGKKLPRREQGATAKALSNVTTIGAAAVDGAANKRHKPTPEVTQGKEAATAVSSIVQEAPAQVMPVVPAALFTALPSSAPKFSGKLKQKLIGAGGVHSVVPTLIPVTAAPPVAEAPSNSHTSAVSTAEAVQDVIALPPSQAQSHSQSPPRSQEQDHRIEATGEPLNPHNPSQHRQSMEEEDLRQSMQDYSAIDDFVANYSTIAPTLPVTKSMNMDLDMDVTQLAAKLHNTTTTPVTKGKAPARQQQREDLRISALRNTSDYPVPVRPARVLVDAAVSPMPASYLPAPPTHASGDFPSTDLGAQGVLLFEDDADSGNNTHAGVLPMEPFKGNSAGETIDPRTVEMCMDTGESESEYPPQQSIEEIIAAHRKPPTPPGTPPIMPATAGSIPRPHSAIPSAVRSGVSSTTTSSAVGADGASRGVPPRRPSTGGTTASRDGELHHPSILTPGLVALPHPASPVLTHRTVSHSNSTTASLFSPADMKPTEEPELMPPSLPMPSISFVDDEPEQQPEPKAHIPVHQNTVSSTERNPLLSPFSDAVAYFEARRSQQQQGDTTGRSGSLRSARTSRNSSLHNSMTAASASPSSSRGDGAGADGENQFKSSSANQARASSAASGMEDLDYNGQNEDPNQQDQHHSEMYDDSQSDFAVYKARSSDISVTWQTEIDSLLDRLQPSAQPALSSMASDTSTSRRSSTSSAVAGGQLSSPAPQLPPSSGAPTPLPEKKKRAIRARVANLLKQVEEAEMEYIAEFGFDAFEKDVGFFEENLPFRRQ